MAAKPELEKRLIAECKAAVPGWASVPDSELKLSVLTGGLSNTLYTCSRVEASTAADSKDKPLASDESPSKVVVRLFGEGSSLFVDAPTERFVSRVLPQSGIGPRVFSDFGDGRVEQFLSGRTLGYTDLSRADISLRIAEQMGRLHALQLPDPDAASSAGDGKSAASVKLARDPAVYRNLRSWLAAAQQITFVERDAKPPSASSSADADNQRKQALLDSLAVPSLDAEVEWLIENLQQLNSPVVFCHNDLQEGNVMCVEHAGGSDSDCVGLHFADSFAVQDMRHRWS